MSNCVGDSFRLLIAAMSISLETRMSNNKNSLDKYYTGVCMKSCGILTIITLKFNLTSNNPSNKEHLALSNGKGYQKFIGQNKYKWDKFPHSPILHYACRSLLMENNRKNNAIAMGLCAVFVVSW